MNWSYTSWPARSIPPLSGRSTISILILAVVGCTSTGAVDLVALEAPLVVLSPEYTLRSEVNGQNCAPQGGSLSPNSAQVTIQQKGNRVFWTQSFEEANTEPSTVQAWRLTGQLCEAESGRLELRLRGQVTARKPVGEMFCRAELQLPAPDEMCAEDSADLCEDPHAIRLEHDACSGVLSGAFFGCIRYSEACNGQPACSFEYQLLANPNTAADTDLSCPPVEQPAVDVTCGEACRSCGCAAE